MRKISMFLLTVALVAIGLPISAAHAAAPANDQFGNAETLAASGSIVRSNVGATTGGAQEPLPNCCGDVYATIWFQWKAPVSGRVTFDTYGSDTDTVLAVYGGATQTTAVEVASDDDGMGCDPTSFVQFDAIANVNYHVQIGVWDPAFSSDQIALTWNWNRAARPANDDFASATTITPAASVTTTSTTVGGTAEDTIFAGEFLGTATTWYKTTVAGPTLLKVSFANSPANNPYGNIAANTVQLWSGGATAQPIGLPVNDGQQNVEFDLPAAGTYYFEVIAPTICESGAFQLITSWTSGTAVTTNYPADQYDLVANAANNLGVSMEQLQHDSVFAWSFIYGISGTSPTKIDPPSSGALGVTTVWIPADLPKLPALAAGWQQTQPQTQQTAALGVAFLLSLVH